MINVFIRREKYQECSGTEKRPSEDTETERPSASQRRDSTKQPTFSSVQFSRSVMSDSCHPMDYSPPGSSVHGIFQARILEWVAIPFSRGSSWPRDWTQVSCNAGRLFTDWATRELAFKFSSVQSLSRVWLFSTPWIVARQASHPLPTPGVHSNSCPSSRWCHPAISSSVIPFSSCP